MYHIVLCSIHKDDAVDPVVRQDSAQVLDFLIFSPQSDMKEILPLSSEAKECITYSYGL